MSTVDTTNLEVTNIKAKDSTAAMSIADSTGVVSLTANPVLSGGGITFPATQVASSNANTLDDYEEGTFTPTLYVTSGSPSYQYQYGYYTKIGRQVFGGGIIGITNSNTLGGGINIVLPFTIGSLTNGFTTGYSSDGSGFTWPVTQGGNSFYSLSWQGYSGNNRMAYVGVGANASEVTYTSGGVGSTWYTRFAFSIFVN